jgi:hypothetical protein
MGQGQSSDAVADEFQMGGAEEDLVAMDAKPVSTVGGARRRSAGSTRAKTHKAPTGRRNKTRKTK